MKMTGCAIGIIIIPVLVISVQDLSLNGVRMCVIINGFTIGAAELARHLCMTCDIGLTYAVKCHKLTHMIAALLTQAAVNQNHSPMIQLECLGKPN